VFELHVNMTSEVLAVLSMEIISILGLRSGRWVQTFQKNLLLTSLG